VERRKYRFHPALPARTMGAGDCAMAVTSGRLAGVWRGGGPRGEERAALFMAARLGGLAVLLAVVPFDDRWIVKEALVVTAGALTAALVLRYAFLLFGRVRRQRRWLPISFDGRPTGRFRVLPRWRERQVEIWAGPDLAVELRVHPRRDEIVTHADVEIDEAELEQLGAAMGTAMILASVAEKQFADADSA
jgi:hypothetical protein